MIILIDTRGPVLYLTLRSDQSTHDYEWEAGRQLAKGMLEYLRQKLEDHDATFEDITAIGVAQGPGSFTGLRIGLTVMNTLASSLSVPIVGAQGDGWRKRALERLGLGDNDQIVMPVYGAEANVTKPRK